MKDIFGFRHIVRKVSKNGSHSFSEQTKPQAARSAFLRCAVFSNHGETWCPGAESRTPIWPCFNFEKYFGGVGRCQQSANKSVAVGMGEWFDSDFLWKSDKLISLTLRGGSRGPQRQGWRPISKAGAGIARSHRKATEDRSRRAAELSEDG